MASIAFTGNDRFEVLEKLGSGGMGTVFRVRDRKQDLHVAMKSVGMVAGDDLLRFKREFRSLQNFDHPNVISFGELFEFDGTFCYTMELVEGTTFLRYVRPHDRGETHGTAVLRKTDEAPTETATRAPSAPQKADARFDEPRLRSTLIQLVHGLNALHAAGLVHRDIKPSNLMVRDDGRLVILDLGLVTALHDGVQHTDVGVMGTYPFMSPEQSLGHPVDARSDWYSAGVVLFRAITGRLPLSGDALTVLAAKTTVDAPEAREFVDNVPEDLNALCRDLLQRDPALRPDGETILARLGSSTGIQLRSHAGGPESLFFGRDEERDRLLQTYRDAAGQGVVLLTGEAGIGKSALAARFVSDLRDEHPNLLVLRGNGSERESLPFSTLDGAVDELSSYLARTTDDTIRELAPAHASLLVQAFPVLKRVEHLSSVRHVEVRDPQERRLRVFSAMRTLLGRVAKRQPTLLLLEDLQWLDADSRALLEELVREPDAPRLFILGTHRTSADSEDRIGDALASLASFLRAEKLAVGPLGDQDARRLAEATMEEREGVDGAQWIDAICRAGQGHPLFLDTAARYVDPDGDPSEGLNLDDLYRGRLARLDEGEREILRVAAVAGGPLSASNLAEVSGLERSAVTRRIAALRVGRLLRVNGDQRYSCYHDRIRAAVLTEVDEETAGALHRRLAETLDGAEDVDPATRARHWAAVGERLRAARAAVEGGENAAVALAYEHAAALYAYSLELVPEGSADAEGLEGRREALARALSNAGRRGEAAENFLLAAERAEGTKAIDLRRRAADQLMVGGHRERGAEVAKIVLKDLRISLPSTSIGLVLSILWVSIRLFFVRPARLEPEPSTEEPDDETLLRIDTLHSLAIGLAVTEVVLGLDFYRRALLLALRSGDDERVASHLAIEAGQTTTMGRVGPRFYRAIQAAKRVANRSGSARARGMVAFGEGMGYYLGGEPAKGLPFLDDSLRIFREECAEAPSELIPAQVAGIHACWESGKLMQVSHRISRARQEGRERGDVYLQVTVATCHGLEARCLEGRPELGLEEAERAMEEWGPAGFDVQCYTYYLHTSFAMLYAGRHEEAVERVREGWRRMRWSILMTVAFIRFGAHLRFGLLLLGGAARDPSQRARLVREAQRFERRLRRGPPGWALPGEAILRGTRHVLSGDMVEGLSWLRIAEERAETAGMAARAAAARWARGELLGGAEGEALVDSGRRFFIDEGAKEPRRFAAMLAPTLAADELIGS